MTTIDRRASWMRRRGGVLAAFVVSALVAGAVGAPIVAAATPTDLFISEYVEGTSNNKAIELYNGTTLPIDLGVGGYVLDIYTNGASEASTSIALTGVIASGDAWVIANPSAVAGILAVADATNAGLNFNGNDTIVLRTGATQLDVFGQIGFDPGIAGWGTDPTNTVDNTLIRKSSITAGRVSNGAFDPAVEWDGFFTDAISDLGSHAQEGGPDTGIVDVEITIPSSATCIELSTTSVSFGTVPFGSEGASATPNIGVTNCSAASASIYARGTDADDGADAHWALVDSTATCADTLGLDAFRLGLVSHQSAEETGLSTTNKLLETQPAGATPVFHLTTVTPCPGSTGSGSTMSMQVIFVATAPAS